MFTTKLHKLCYSTETYIHRIINTFLSNKTSDLNTLLQSHAFIITTGHTNNVYIAAKLISLYAYNKHHLINSRKVFDLISFKDPFIWNSIIKTYFSNGYYSEALDFYSNMRGFNALPDQFTIPIVVSACAELGLIYYGKKIHGLVSKLNLFHGNNAAVGSSLVYMYSKCGFIAYAADKFGEITVRDVVSWTAIVKGYVENGESEKGLEYLCLMRKNGESEVRPNFRTLEGGFQACGNLGALVEGKCLHGLTVKSGFGSHQVVQCSLLSMYSKCGSVEETYRSFCDVDEKDLFSWTSIIAV